MVKKKSPYKTVGRVRLGNRVYRIRDDERLIGERARWQLSEFASWSEGDWKSLKLFDRTRGAKKRVYQLGFNTQDWRMASNIGWRRVSSEQPDIAQWVLMIVEKEWRSTYDNENDSEKQACEATQA